jgi:hypothetical protein
VLRRSLCWYEISDLQKLQILFYRGYVVTGLLNQLAPDAEAIDVELLGNLKATVYALDELLSQHPHDDLSYLRSYAPQTD